MHEYEHDALIKDALKESPTTDREREIWNKALDTINAIIQAHAFMSGPDQTIISEIVETIKA